MTTTYGFTEQLAIGEQGERFLDSWFGHFYEITPATDEEQRLGFDRRFAPLNGGDGEILKVEYKTDGKAFSTGNAFVETFSVDKPPKLGWAVASQADRLAYYLPDGDLIYWLKLRTIRERIPYWTRRYPTRPARNFGYWTHGICVPLDEFERHSQKVINLADYDVAS